MKQRREESQKQLKEHQENMPIKVNLTEIEEKVNHGRRMKEEIEKSQREQKLKIDSYSKYVREMYWPKVSA